MSDRERQIEAVRRILDRWYATQAGPAATEIVDALAAVPSEVTDEQEALRQIRDFDAWQAFPGKQDRPETATSQAMRKIARAALEAGGSDEHLREALLVAADDLDKAANQFQGLYDGILKQYVQSGQMPGVNVRRFAEKAARAREAAGVRPTEEGSDDTCVYCGEKRGPHEFEDGLRCVYCAEADEAGVQPQEEERDG